MVVSRSRSLRSEDVARWAKNALIFASPALLVLLADLRELIPENAAYGALFLALYGIAVDLFRKWYNQNRY